MTAFIKNAVFNLAELSRQSVYRRLEIPLIRSYVPFIRYLAEHLGRFAT